MFLYLLSGDFITDMWVWTKIRWLKAYIHEHALAGEWAHERIQNMAKHHREKILPSSPLTINHFT